MKNKDEVFHDEDSKAWTATKEEVIDLGMKYLEGIGSRHLCQVCIPRGGSCCKDCHQLKEGEGCQQRNTGCTAWLCGFLKFIFFEAGLLQEWDGFWDQIPGKDFRGDSTPPVVVITRWLSTPNVQALSKALAKDLSELMNANNRPGYVNELNNELDWYVTRLFSYEDPELLRTVRKKLKKLTRDFRHFQSAKEEMDNSK